MTVATSAETSSSTFHWASPAAFPSARQAFLARGELPKRHAEMLDPVPSIGGVVLRPVSLWHTMV